MPWLTATAAAQALGLCQRTVREMVKRGQIPARRYGDDGSWWRISSEDVKRLAAMRARAKARKRVAR